MSKSDKENWIKGKDLENVGFEVKPPAVRLHGTGETLKHAVVKLLVARVLQKRGRKWDTEVKGPDGRVDVLDFGPDDGQAVVWEIQTNASRQAILDKVEQYESANIRDVLVIDPTEAPDEIQEMESWVEGEMFG